MGNGNRDKTPVPFFANETKIHFNQVRDDTSKKGKLMKLVFCPFCHDVFELRPKEWRTCKCGKVGGMYKDNLNAEITKDAIPLGFDNFEFMSALRNRPKKGLGRRFEAFVIPEECPTIHVISEDKQDNKTA
jgi:hypothetical protein